MSLAQQFKDETTVASAWLPAAMDACALFRMYIPHLNMPLSKFRYEPRGLPSAALVDSQVIVVQRQATLNNYNALKLMKEELGLKVIYDLDDNLWCLPAYNKAKKIFEQAREGFEICAQLCDVLTVSTKGLKTAVQTSMPGLKQEIVVVPNAMDFRYFRPTAVQHDDRVVIGWAGSDTHTGDLADVWNLLPGVVEKNPNVYLEIVGTTVPAKLKGHPRVIERPWVQVGEYPSRLATWGWDISLAPLEDNRFNRSKSNIKILESAAVGFVCLASAVQPYNEFYCLNDRLSWLLCVSPAEWKMKLEILIHEPELRKELSAACYKAAHTFYNIDDIKQNWKRVIEAVA